MHEKVQCTQCHVKPVFTQVGKNCQDCHTDVHQRKMGTDCASCHTVLGWRVSTQQLKDHQNRFPLFGAHAAVPCEECHKSAAVGQFQGLSTDCISCHLKNFQSTTNPNHTSANFPTTCQTCHSADSWLSATFDHSSTGFPLTAGHANVPCASCHINNNYNLQIAPTDCGNSGCHLSTWQQTNNPVHSTAGPAFAAANCATCHTTKGWDAASFDHSVTGFTLVGTHMSPSPTPCASCHVSNNYSLSSADCMGCHLAAWNSTPTYGGSVPDHIKSGFPTTASACSTCHPITKWSDGKFDHSATGWALTGAHTTTPCASCHISNNYTLTAANTDCYGCHTAAWQSTTTLGGSVPNHIAAGYPTTCATCHTTTSWLGATFDHTYFPIPHHGSVCSDCHLVSTNYATFSCINCHTQSAHAKAQTDQNHGGVSGYVYGPTTCYNCHKNGGGG
jgi:nitrate/TMAO reductase-like tetraheme cytochrome c subunit